tara:strand:- start:1570 stop:2052 length:483 start_codon:yes stop_codon:yes gene_type:complete
MPDIPTNGRLLFALSTSMKALSKGRPRAGKSGHFYTPKRTRDFEAAIREAGEFAAIELALCPVRLVVRIVHEVPVSWPKWKRAAAEAGLYSPTQGDLDNKTKAISDALNGIAYMDDCQICNLDAEMTYGASESIKVWVHRAGYSLAEIKEHGVELITAGA